jgi:hypothetical protein
MESYVPEAQISAKKVNQWEDFKLHRPRRSRAALQNRKST